LKIIADVVPASSNIHQRAVQGNKGNATKLGYARSLPAIRQEPENPIGIRLGTSE